MPADSLHIKQIAIELNELLRGGRIDKLTMPEPDEIILHIHAKANHTVVMSANPSLPRVHITKNAPKNNPLTAPAFLMHLRKHIGGASITEVTAHDGERILMFALKARNELGYEEKKTLICEIMGKYANIILTNADGKISECIKHISPASSEKRPVLPGLTYSFPPPQNKVNIFDGSALKSVLSSFDGGNAGGYILANAAGLAPATVNAITTAALGGLFFNELTTEQTEKLADAFNQTRILKNAKPCVRKESGVKSDFWIKPFEQDGEYEFFNSLNEAMDAHFFALDRDRRLSEKARIPKTTVKNAIARTEKKLKLFRERKAEASDAETDRLNGELITANIYRLKQGMSSFEAENYYEEPPQKITVKLDSSKSPQYNAQAYFKKYAKKKKTLSIVEEQIAEAVADLEYFNSIYDSFSFTDAEGLEEITAELYAANLLHEPKGKRKKEKLLSGGEIVFEGCTIRWGKTNYQNDRLTKAARASDTWLHTQKIHGSHVIVSGENVSERVLVRAAQIAAYYSKARLGENVPVDYTLKKYVSKPKGSPPGKVVYTDYKTLFVTPQDERS
ncbi:MAG: fibronectin/fibrinogen-binding protein [Clostridia bacterium]|nr:fibronectin/fibrinogen-binding protein [Clostridia bacterium]